MKLFLAVSALAVFIHTDTLKHVDAFIMEKSDSQDIHISLLNPQGVRFAFPGPTTTTTTTTTTTSKPTTHAQTSRPLVTDAMPSSNPTDPIDSSAVNKDTDATNSGPNAGTDSSQTQPVASGTLSATATACSGSCGCTGSSIRPLTCSTFPCLIFEDNFDTLNLDVWEHEITASSGGNWEFEYNSYVRDCKLFIKPIGCTHADIIASVKPVNKGHP